MLLKKLFTIFIPFVLFHGSVHGQDNTRYNGWSRLTLQSKLGEHLSLDNELQHRRQNDYNNRNYLSKNLMFSYRSWLHYKPGGKVSYGLSPFALLQQFPQYQQPTDTSKEAGYELRFAAAVTVHQPLLGPLILFSKSGLEYRAFIDKPDKIRARERIGLSYSKNNWQLNIYEELLLHVAGAPISNLFDQNRLSASVSLSATDRLGLELGYIHTDKLPGNASELVQEENLFVNISYKIGKH